MSLSEYAFSCASIFLPRSLFLVFLPPSLHVSLLLHIPLLFFLLSLYLSVSFSVSLTHPQSHTPNIIGTQELQPPPISLSGQNLLYSVRLRNARSGAAAGVSEMPQNCLPSVRAESQNNEKLSVNFRLLPPALLRNRLLCLQLRCKFPHWM